MAPHSCASALLLAGRAVHVWVVRIGRAGRVVTRLEPYLSGDEAARAARFRFDRDRRPFVVARGILRLLLGRYLGADPAALRFAYGEHGKPRLATPGPMRFNVSASGELAVLAFAYNCDVGVDIEAIRHLDDAAGLAEQFFSDREASQLGELPERDRAAAFFRGWSRKEAYLKAIGRGLSAPLDTFTVTLRDRVPARLVDVGGNADAAATWTLHDLGTEPGYAAALAYEDAPRPLRVTVPLDVEQLLDVSADRVDRTWPIRGTAGGTT